MVVFRALKWRHCVSSMVVTELKTALFCGAARILCINLLLFQVVKVMPQTKKINEKVQ